jgi:cytidylate kinase
MAEDPDLRFFLSCPFEERVRRIAEREGRDLEEVGEETRAREESERERFMRFYGVDVGDLSIYDVVLNTGLYDADAAARILKKVVDEYLQGM